MIILHDVFFNLFYFIYGMILYGSYNITSLHRIIILTNISLATGFILNRSLNMFLLLYFAVVELTFYNIYKVKLHT